MAVPKAAKKTGVDSKQELAIARELSYWHFDFNFMFSARNQKGNQGVLSHRQTLKFQPCSCDQPALSKAENRLTNSNESLWRGAKWIMGTDASWDSRILTVLLK